MENREPQAPRPCRRVGTLTFGVVLVVSGSLMLAATFFPALDLVWALKLSPLALILLGGEVLAAARGKGQIQYDWVGMLLCCLIVSAALVLFAAAWYLTALPAPLR
ncbi:hypothetical protein [Dysosmobacter sp.]